MKKFEEKEIFDYLVNNPAYEDGDYHVLLNSETCCFWEIGDSNDDKVVFRVECPYDEDVSSADEFWAKENIDDEDFMKIVEIMTKKVNEWLANE